MKRIYVVGAIVIVVLLTGGYFVFSKGSNGDVRYRTDKVTRGNVVVQVRATGTVNPPQTVQIGSQVSGIISKLFVDYNSVVKKGQVVAVIDSTFLYAAVQQAQANVERNNAELNKAKRDLSRQQDLFKKSLVAQADLDAATATYESDLAMLKQAQASLNQARVNLDYAIIRAPNDGVIIERAVDVGQTVAASFQAPKLFTLATDLHRMQVEASVDEADIGQIKEQQPVTFTVDAYPDQTFDGIVTQVRLNPIITQNVVTYTVIISVENPELKLRPGMTATASILVDRRENVLRVPTLATRFTPPQDVLDKYMDQQSGGQAGGGQQGRQDTQANSQRQQQSGGQQSGGSQGDRQQGDRSAWRQRMGGGQGMMRGGQGMGGGAQAEGLQIGHSSSSGPRPARIWILEGGKNPKPIMAKVGLVDNRFAEIISDELKEGDEVIVGVSAADNAANAGNGQTNPFQQRGPGGGPGRRM